MSSRLQELDSRLSSRARVAESPGMPRRLAGLLAHSGDSWFWIPALLILYLAGPADWKQFSLEMLVGIVATAIVVMLLKFTIKRRRPEGSWGEIYRKTDPHSFPSGHAARGAVLATIAIGSGPPWFALLLLVWAPLMALSRVAMGLHFLSDILGGILVGVLIGIIVLNYF